MKNILIGLILSLLFGCTGLTNLEERVSRLEQLQDEMIPSTELAGADSRWRDGRTTEGDSNIDEITGMVDGDWTTALEESGATSSIYFYAYDTTTCPSSDGTTQIDGSGGGCWHLTKIHVASIVGEADDGDHYVNFSNSGIESYTESDGDLTARRDWNVVLFEDSTDGWIPQTNSVVKTTAGALDLTSGDNEKYCFGGMVVITATGEIELPPLSTGMMEIWIVSTTTGTIYIDPNVNENINIDGVPGTNGYRIETTQDGAAVLLRNFDSDTWIAIDLTAGWSASGS